MRTVPSAAGASLVKVDENRCEYFVFASDDDEEEHFGKEVGALGVVPGWCIGVKGPHCSSLNVGFLCSIGVEGDKVKHVYNSGFIFGDEPSKFHGPSS